MRGHGRFWAVVFAFCALALPAVAQAAPTWQLAPDPAPGGVEDIFAEGEPVVRLAVVDSRPYVSTVSPSGNLTVHTLSADGSRWRQIGGALNTRPVEGVAELASSGRTVWVAWRERTAAGLLRVHVARLRGGRFRQILGGLKRTDSSNLESPFELAVFGARPYVVYRGAGGRLRVVRLAGADRQFRSLNAGLPARSVYSAHVAAAGRRLYLAYSLGADAPETTRVSRLTTNRRAWRTVASEPAPQPFGSVADAVGGGGRLYLAVGRVVKRLTADGQLVQVGDAPIPFANVGSLGYAGGVLRAFVKTFPAPEVTVPHMFAFTGGSWHEEEGPPWQGAEPPPPFPGDVDTAQFVTGGGTLWFLWDIAGGEMASPRTVHVAHLAG